MRRALAAAVGVGVALAVASGGCTRDARPPGAIRVVVTVPPLVGVVAELLPDDASVRPLVPVGVSVHGYEPAPSDARALWEADLAVGVGLGIEGTLARAIEVSGKRSVWFADAVGVEGDGHDHAHDHDGHDHAHGSATDAHLWLDPALVDEFAGVIAEELAAMGARDPSLAIDRATTMGRLGELRTRIRELDAELASILGQFEGRAVVIHHNAFVRLCERYGVRVAGVLLPSGSGEASPAEVERVRAALRDEGVGGVFVEPQMDGALARRIAEEAGVPVGTLDPLGDGDWFAMMRANALEIARVLELHGG